MEREFHRFKEKYQDKYKIEYEWDFNENTGRYHKLSTFIPSRAGKPEIIEGKKVFEYMVYPYSIDGKTLVALMSPRKSRNLLREYPDIFKKHLEADDCFVLLFDETYLPKVARALMLRKKRKLSPEQRERQIKRLSQYQFKASKPASESGKTP